MTLVLFDLDNTLIAGDSDHLWGEFLVQQGLVDAAAYRARNDEFYLAYQRGELDIEAYLNFSLEPLARFSQEELAQFHGQFLHEMIQPLRLPQAEALIAEHQQRGDLVAIITSTNRFITQPIAELLQIEHLMATELEMLDGRYSGQILGRPCYREGKIHHLKTWLKDKPYSMKGSYFYSDSINDLPLLSEVDNPVAVDPDPELEAEARRQGWQIISLRGQ